MRRRWLFALLLHLAFFSAWAGLETWRRRGAPEFLLATEGADPRDLLAGDYLALAFPDARLDAAKPSRPAGEGAAVAVLFEAQGNTVVAGQAWPLRRAVRKEPVPDGDFSPYPAAAGWARGEARGGRVSFGIERFYFPEDREMEYRALRPGRYWALVALSPDGRLRIRRLVW